MGEGNKDTSVVAYIDGKPVGEIQEIPELSMLGVPETETGGQEIVAAQFDGTISTEKLAEVTETLRAAFAALTATFEQVAKVMQDAASAIAWAYELERALQWAEIYKPQLVHIYRHTKKGRIREKNAKRILAWYREEVLG